ncbi:MAG: hypothetical protein JW943_13945 [Deltaproteobacteria bacterium]|nr:hypothetical protein [Deltaproteobacteria bacterium]
MSAKEEKKAEKTEEVKVKAEETTENKPKQVGEVLIKAMENGAIELTVSKGMNLWALCGILAKATNAACGLTTKPAENA